MGELCPLWSLIKEWECYVGSGESLEIALNVSQYDSCCNNDSVDGDTHKLIEVFCYCSRFSNSDVSLCADHL